MITLGFFLVEGHIVEMDMREITVSRGSGVMNSQEHVTH